MSKLDKTCYDYSRERAIHFNFPGAQPAYLRECIGHLPPSESEYRRPSLQPHADLYAWAIVDPHNMPAVTRCWFLLNNVRDGDIDVRRAPENTYASDRLVDPRSIEAGKPSKIAKPQRADRHAKRILKRRRKYWTNAKMYHRNGHRWPRTLRERILAWLGLRYAKPMAAKVVRDVAHIAKTREARNA